MAALSDCFSSAVALSSGTGCGGPSEAGRAGLDFHGESVDGVSFGVAGDETAVKRRVGVRTADVELVDFRWLRPGESAAPMIGFKMASASSCHMAATENIEKI